MSEFELAVTRVLLHEGKLSKDKRDPGGTTNYGISMRWLSQQGELIGDIDRDGDVDENDVVSMTIGDAKRFYKQFWWDKYGYGRIDNQRVADKIMSFSVNMGARQAHIIWQRALNALGASLIVDGVVGSLTLAQTNKVSPDALERALSDEAAKFYKSLVAKRPELGVYLKGWLNRAYA